jgi:hypothetical protein
VRLSRVTWLVLATTMALVSGVILAATFLVNVGHQALPQGGGSARGGVVQVGASRHQGAGQPGGGKAPGVAPSPGPSGAAAQPGRPIAAHPAGAGVVASIGRSPRPLGAIPRPGLPTKQQYANTVQLLHAALGSR